MRGNKGNDISIDKNDNSRDDKNVNDIGDSNTDNDDDDDDYDEICSRYYDREDNNGKVRDFMIV